MAFWHDRTNSKEPQSNGKQLTSRKNIKGQMLFSSVKARYDEEFFILFIQLHQDGVQVHAHSTFHKTFTKVSCSKTLTSKHSQYVNITSGRTTSTWFLLIIYGMECWNTEKKKQYGFVFQGEMLFIITSAVCFCRKIHPDYFIFR